MKQESSRKKALDGGSRQHAANQSDLFLSALLDFQNAVSKDLFWRVSCVFVCCECGIVVLYYYCHNWVVLEGAAKLSENNNGRT